MFEKTFIIRNSFFRASREEKLGLSENWFFVVVLLTLISIEIIEFYMSNASKLYAFFRIC